MDNQRSAISPKTALPFAWASIAWALIGGCLCWEFSASGTAGLNMQWMILFWALCLVDILALAKAISALLKLMTGLPENKAPYLIQASYWGMIKLACLGFFAAVLLRGHGIPSLGLLLGLGTLVVVPLAGGFWWSQRVLRHA